MKEIDKSGFNEVRKLSSVEFEVNISDTELVLSFMGEQYLEMDK